MYYAIVRLKEGYRPIAVIRLKEEDFGQESVGKVLTGPHELPRNLRVLYADNFGSGMPCSPGERAVRIAQMVPGFITMGWRQSDTPPFPAHWLRDFRGLSRSKWLIDALQALGAEARKPLGVLAEA